MKSGLAFTARTPKVLFENRKRGEIVGQRPNENSRRGNARRLFLGGNSLPNLEGGGGGVGALMSVTDKLRLT